MSYELTVDYLYLAQAMHAVGQDRFDELEQMLVGGTAGAVHPKLAGLGAISAEKAAEVMEAARAEYDRDRALTRTRKALHAHIQEAQNEIAKARRAMRDLDEMWGDVEYEGGHADTEHHLGEALRSLRAAQAVKPSDALGENR